MDEYISREATIKRIKEVYCVGCNSYHGVRCRACGTGDAIDMIEDAPTVDAVVVTRCKDCQYRGLICCPAIHETIGNGLVDCAVDNGYCWCGKPKET